MALFLAVIFAIDWFNFVGGWAGWLIGSLIGIIGVRLAWEDWLKYEHDGWMRKFWKELTKITEECIRTGKAESVEPVVAVTFPASSDDVRGFCWDGSMALFHHADGAYSTVDVSGTRIKDRLTVLSHVHTPAPDRILIVTPSETQVSDPQNPVDK
ncbi:hypothetical protein ACTU45_30845 [Streptomyces sp. 24-1644]|uniref:hypothetical protein n=1 Tax=Streptomyces sp. 24-1644 TaxID=3457315 RepID=UPI003FA78174